MTSTQKIIIGIDAGTSVIKAVAFDLSGRQIAIASVRNRYATGDDGSATQSLDQTWLDCASALRGLGEKVENLAPAPQPSPSPDRATAPGSSAAATGRSPMPGYGSTRARRRRSATRRRNAESCPLRGDRHRPQHLPAGRATRPYGPLQRRSFSIGRRRRCTARTGSISTSPACGRPIHRRRASPSAISERARYDDVRDRRARP